MPRRLFLLLVAVLVVVVGGPSVLVLGGDDPSSPGPSPTRSTPSRTASDPDGCGRTAGVVDIGISGTRYPAVRRHWERAIRDGRPRILTVNRAGAAERRRILLRGIPTRAGDDRDEYPPAMARTSPDADVAYVDASQNRGAGSVQGIKLRRWCSGQRFRVVWY